MSDDRRLTYSTTHNTAKANASSSRTRPARAAKHYANNPGPQDRLSVAAGPSRPRVPNAKIAWEPTLGGSGAKKVWDRAEDRRAHPEPERAGQGYEGGSVKGNWRAGTSSATGQNSAQLNFAGMLDDLDGATRVDMNGVPILGNYETGTMGLEQRTSQGKTQVDYMRHFAERNLAPKYAQLIIAFRFAPPPHLRCSVCQRASVGRWRCAHCVGRRDYCTGCLRQTHANQPLHFVGWWTGQHYRRAWLRDAGVAIQLCPNALPGEFCPANPGFKPDLDALDMQEPRAYGSYSAHAFAGASQTTQNPATDVPLTSAMNPDDEIHLPPHFDDVDDGEREDTRFMCSPVELDDFQPIGEDDDAEDDITGAAGSDGAAGGVVRDAGKSAIPTKDMFGFRTLVIIHIDGIHGLGVGFCKCEGHLPEDEQLLQYGGLYPASQDCPSTAFTLQFLEYRHIDDVVCKTSTQSHMRKIRRCTEPEEPRLAPNRYGEAIVVSRQYEAIKNLVDFGYATQPLQDWKGPPPGGLVWKCVVCPRMTAEFNNLPKVWQDDPEEWRKFVSLAYDGNFSGDHTVSRQPDNNVPLFPGTGMFDHPDSIKKHMDKAVDDKDLRRMDPNMAPDDKVCHEHRAAAGVGKTRSRVVDIKGIGSWACSRHGCFCAGATNNFMLGESQHPVDKSLSNAFQHTITEQITRVQLLYDIWCRYGVHVRERFRHSGLDWPKFRELLQGVGVWHIYGHVFECLRRFSPTYSPRSGIVDGEILETLWSLLNAILQSCRGMSLAAREEKINAHMNDINYRKTIEMVGTLVRKLRKYTKELHVRRRHLQRLELSCDEVDLERWELARQEIEERRVKDPYYADEFWKSVVAEPAPVKAAVEVRLLEEDHSSGLAKVIIASLKLEEAGLRMQAQGKTWGTSLTDRRTAAIARTRFNNRRLNANREMTLILGGDAVEEEDLLPARLAKLLDEDEWTTEDDTLHNYNLRAKAEFKPVDLPSSRIFHRHGKRVFSETEKRAMDIELELRLGDMEARLQSTREGVCDQAQGYRLEIRNKKGKGRSNYRDRTNAWLHVRQQTKDVRVHAAMYNHHVRRMHRLMWDDTPEALTRYEMLRARYRPILADDIRCSTATYETYNDIRTRGDFKLPWFWRMQHADSALQDVNEDIGERGREPGDDASFIGDFFRTRWINAKCAVVRCEEEEFMLQGEMQTCYLGYLALAYSWRRRWRLLPPPGDGAVDGFAGLRAHSLQNMHNWLDLAAQAKVSFNSEIMDLITDDLQ